jgi:hypothetical protein
MSIEKIKELLRRKVTVEEGEEILAALEQPENQTEFTKEVRLWAELVIATKQYSPENIEQQGIYLSEACDIIDQQAADYLELCSMTNAIKESVFKELEKNRLLQKNIDQQAEWIKVLTGALDDLVSEHILAGSDIAGCVNDHLKAALKKAQEVLER